MKTLGLAAFLAIGTLYTASSAGAASPCEIKTAPLPVNLNMSAEEIQKYQVKLKQECELSQRYLNLAKALEASGLQLEDITKYQAMRYVRSVNYQESKTANLPIEKTYQVKKEYYSLPVEKRFTVIWRNFIAGVEQLIPAKQSLLSGKNFTIEDLKKIHVGYFTKSNETGDYSNVPDQGIFKPAVDNDLYWWAFSSDQELNDTRKSVDQINSLYKKMGLLDNSKDADVYDVLRIRHTGKKFKDGTVSTSEFVDAIYSGDTRANQEHVKNVIGFMNANVQQGREGKHMVYKGRAYTPAEVAFLTQQFYVQVHPFNDGNGRTSRFMQELVLTSFDLPHGSSGDLMDIDVLTPFEKYYESALRSTNELLGAMETCQSEYKKYFFSNNKRSLYKYNDKFDYDCRILVPASEEEVQKEDAELVAIEGG